MLWSDLRYALRLMRRSPGFTAVAVLSLALGIGANTAIYSLFYTIMLRPLAVAHPEQLVQLVQNLPGEPHWGGYSGWTTYEYFRDRNHVFLGVTGMSVNNLAEVRTEGSETETLIKEKVPGSYFTVMGLAPAAGRLIAEGDDESVAVVSWPYWNTRLHRDPAVLGKRIVVDDEPKTIIGVAPRGYVGPRVGVRTDIWVRSEHDDLHILARLKPGVTLQQAQAEMSVLYRFVLEQRAATTKDPRVWERTIEVVPAGSGLVRVRDQYGKPLILLMAVVGLLLLLACINMASMLLARSAKRQREIAVRVGLGATRGRLVRQMLTESVLLSASGTCVGIVVAYFGAGVLVRIMASSRAFEHIDVEVQPDLHLLAFTAGLALVTGLLFGLAPAWHCFRAAPASGLRQRRRWLGRGLVAAQVALSILLVTSAGVFLTHLSRLRNFDLGFRSDHVLVVRLDPSHTGYAREQLAARYRELLARMDTIPGVRSASITACAPLEGCGSGGRYLVADGHAERTMTPIAFVAPRYFETLAVPLIAGRDFSFRDVGRPRVAIVNEKLARRYFPGVSPIGRYIGVEGEPGGPYEIVGLAGDMKAIELRDAPYPTIYFHMFQENRLVNEFELRTSAAPESVASAVQRTVREVMGPVPVKRVTTMAEQVDSNIVPERLIATLSEFFGALGATLAGIGLYGLLSYTVARRTSEIGVRMALGATARDVTRLVARDALAMVCSGLIAGTLMVLWSRPLAARLVAGLEPQSAKPLFLGGAAIVAIALVASYIPARRAARVDPMVALRRE